MRTNFALLRHARLLLVLPLFACANRAASPGAGGVPTHDVRWPAEPDPRIAKLMAAAGDDVMALTTVHPGPAPAALPNGRAELPPGTFLASRARPATIIDRLEPGESQRRAEDFLLYQLFLKLAQVDATLRNQDGWLLGQVTTARAEQPAPVPFVTDLHFAGRGSPEPQPNLALPALRRAVVAARELLLAVGRLARPPRSTQRQRSSITCCCASAGASSKPARLRPGRTARCPTTASPAWTSPSCRR